MTESEMMPESSAGGGIRPEAEPDQLSTDAAEYMTSTDRSGGWTGRGDSRRFSTAPVEHPDTRVELADADEEPEEDRRRPLLAEAQRVQLNGEWSQIQARFVDEPRRSVELADALVVDVMRQVTSTLSREHDRLEAQWESGGDVSTEDLRVAFTRYRSFFERLLAS